LFAKEVILGVQVMSVNDSCHCFRSVPYGYKTYLRVTLGLYFHVYKNLSVVRKRNHGLRVDRDKEKALLESVDAQ